MSISAMNSTMYLEFSLSVSVPCIFNFIDYKKESSTISVSGKTIREIETKLNTYARQIATWCSENKMAVNVEKTKSLLTRTHQKRSKLKRNQQDQTIEVKMNEQQLRQIDQQKLLGVVIDQDLIWNDQVNSVCNIVSHNLALFRKIKSYLCCIKTSYKSILATAVWFGGILQRCPHC